ncbi:hypothetical protein CJJ09_002105 [Candidozyma auris]|nr:hypothetical protein CJJ09_002105 [[Candida] auris]
MEARRKSTLHVSSAKRDKATDLSAHVELERLEQETTLVLQEIDRNLSQANAVISDKILPVLTSYHSASSNVWKNVSFWKKFVEDASETRVFPEESNVEGDSAHQGGHTENCNSRKNSTLTSEFQVEASTPQLKSRHSLQSSTSPQRSASRNYPRVSISPRKRGSGVFDSNDARRSSVLQNFLNSSPTLPEPPKLTSELNHHNAPSSSSAPKQGHSDPDLNAGVRPQAALLSPATVTPNAREGIQRFPRTPTYGSSGFKAPISPMRNIPPLQRSNEDSDQVIPLPRMSALPQDDSDQVPLPRLLTTSVGEAKLHSPAAGEEGSSKRRRIEEDESENVFLDANYKDDTNNNSRSHSIVYNTIREQNQQVEENIDQEEHDEGGEQKSKSVSQIFEDVLQPTADNNNADNDEEEMEQKASRGEHTITQNLSRSLDQTTDSVANSSELGSILGERWKALSRTLKKSG